MLADIKQYLDGFNRRVVIEHLVFINIPFVQYDELHYIAAIVGILELLPFLYYDVGTLQ